MHIIQLLKQEHEAIERELIELEKIFEDINELNEVNFPNVNHTFRKLCDIWNSHENEEEEVFPILSRNEIEIDIEKMLTDHKILRVYKNNILDAIDSGSFEKIRIAFSEDVPIMIKKLREHIDQEDNILYTAVLKYTSELELENLKNKFPNLGNWLKD